MIAQIARYALVVELIVLAVILASCRTGDAKAPSEEAQIRAAMTFTARAVVDVDAACSSVVHLLEDAGDKARAKEVSTTCSSIARDALNVLAAAEAGFDAYDASKRGAALCAVGHAAAGLDRIAAIVESNGVKVPSIVREALEFGGAFGVAKGCTPAPATSTNSSSTASSSP